MIINFQKPLTFLLSLFIFHVFTVASEGRGMPGNEDSLKVINDVREYRSRAKADSSQQMVELAKMIPGIVLDLRYAGTNNFMKKNMYREGLTYTFLRLPAARALAAVQSELKQKGFGLKIFDAYRPYSVTQAFWNLVHDERYVANPAKGSGHNRGIAADLTIIDLKTGRELDMGTGFDNFSDSAHHSFTRLSSVILANRELLRTEMEKQGFHLFETEWWHYYWGNPDGFDVLDLDFKMLRKQK